MSRLRNKIKTLKKEIPEKFLICPACGIITTLTQTIEECSSGGNGMCTCEFPSGRVYNEYKELTLADITTLQNNLRSQKDAITHHTQQLKRIQQQINAFTKKTESNITVIGKNSVNKLLKDIQKVKGD